MRPDGIYLRLPFREYLEEPGCLGSSEKGRMWLRRTGFWWASRMNPYFKPQDSTDEQLFGEALHAALLEGLHAYESRYIVAPDKRAHPDALFTVPQIKQALKDAGVYPTPSSGFTKEDWCEAAELYLPDIEVWDNVMASFYRQCRGGQLKPMTGEADFAIRAMRDLAIGPHSTPEMRELLSVGQDFPILAEVSVFYTDETGQRHRARFDKMIPGTTVDAKTLGNWRNRELSESVDDHIKDHGYDIQRADYDMARRAAMQMILADDSCIHGATEEEKDHLIAMANYEAQKDFRTAFAWIFYQKPTSAGQGPVLFPVIDQFGGPYHRSGFRKRAAGLALYRECMERFGPDTPWGDVVETHVTHEGSKAPMVRLGMYGWGPQDEVEGERDWFGDVRSTG